MASVGRRAFSCADAAGPAAPLHPRLQREYGVRGVVGVPLRSEALHGWLFFLDRRRTTTDDMVVGEIVAQQVSARLEHFYLLQRLQQSAVMEERVRLARDLHDGLLQSLAATALQLEALRHTLGQHPPEALDRLHELQTLIVSEQRQLRAFIDELRPAPLLPSAGGDNVATSLRNLAHRIERHWGVRADLAVDELDPGLGELLGYDIAHIVHEALVNAARHGGASSARVEIGTRNGRITILVADNGRGFDFQGRHDLAALTRMNAGPVTLTERVASLGGTLTIDSAPSGARLEIALPVARASA
jgi:signal transduction histidine kinase